MPTARTDYRSRLERVVTDIVARTLVVLPLAWVAMLIAGAWFNNRTPYWGWVLLTIAAMALGEGVQWVWRRIRKRVARRG